MDDMKNPEVISIQRWLLRKKFGKGSEFPFDIEYSNKKDFSASCYNNYGTPRLVKGKKRWLTLLLKVAIISIFLIAIASLIQGTLTNKGSQVQSTSYLSGSFLLEDNPGYQKGIYG